MIKTRLVILFCAIAILASTSSALEFRLLSWAGTIDDLKYANGQKPVEIVAWDSALSPKYQLTGAGPLVLFREIKQEEKTIRVPVATLPPPTGSTHAILLLSATDASNQAYTAVWIDDSPEVRKAQTITYYNLSSYPVLIKLGTEEISLAPQAMSIRATDPAFERLALKVAAQTEAGWEIVASRSHAIRPGLRTLVILRDGRTQGNGLKDRIDFLSFNDKPPAPAPLGEPVVRP
ncbi:MAG: hypothetical protein K0R17_2216 [Rariglobus sp.]|nr:hypothetical protein [Rariglobus sp.]